MSFIKANIFLRWSSDIMSLSCTSINALIMPLPAFLRASKVSNGSLSSNVTNEPLTPLNLPI
ncbi:hypothetical protein [Carnobacterium divergens]|uniref:hypothetical protein n=1 Tax=Carnobacterium divergens TaxID=2748 RepID=UPI0039B04261